MAVKDDIKDQVSLAGLEPEQVGGSLVQGGPQTGGLRVEGVQEFGHEQQGAGQHRSFQEVAAVCAWSFITFHVVLQSMKSEEG